MAENSADSDQILLRFNRLIRELLQGGTRREWFQRWKVELLLDIQMVDDVTPGPDRVEENTLEWTVWSKGQE
jgi:hypothetical protein